jgi:peptidoglycan/LPS O-acetylase OafA/YrhL
LSGFLITGRLLDEYRRAGEVSLKDFYVRRAFRILPCCYSYLLVLLVIAIPWGLTLRGRDVAGSAFFFRNYTGSVLPGHMYDGDQWYTGHFWSLAVEEHFYLLWPAVIMLVGFKRSASAAASLAITVGLWRWLEFNERWTAMAYVNDYFRTDLRLDYLLWGCFFACIFPQLSASLRSVGISRYMTPLFVSIYLFNFRRPLALHILWDPLLVACMVVSTVAYSDGFFGRILESRSLKYIGKRSYSLYVWHILFLVSPLATRPLGLLQSFPVGVLLACIAAIVSYRFIEKPCIRLGKQLLATPRIPAIDIGNALSVSERSSSALDQR